MHDISREALLCKQGDKRPVQTTHNPDGSHHEGHSHGHDHPHEPDAGHTHEGHGHRHHQHSYPDHAHDEHGHTHDRGQEAFHHQHEHKHVFYHSHPHEHDRVRRTLAHRVLKDPARDWFGVGLILLLILVGLFRLLPPELNSGLFLAAAVIALFPALKNALFAALHRKKLSPELLVVAGLLAMLFRGYFLTGAVAGLFLLVGSFLRLDFSWSEP